MILGPNGPIQIDDKTIILFFESALFDSSHLARQSPLNTARISLENRSQAVCVPENWLDNLSGNLDALETELKALYDTNVVICLHSNQLLLEGSRDVVDRFKAIIERHKIILSISVPPSIVDESQGAEYLASHVHYGSSNGALLFGMLGPLVIDELTDIGHVRMYTIAQEKAGNVLMLVHVRRFERLKRLITDFGLSLNYARTVFVGLRQENVDELLESSPHLNILITLNPDSICRQDRRCLSPSRSLGILERYRKEPKVTIVMSTGCMYKTDLIKFGGQGFKYSMNFLRPDSLQYFESSKGGKQLIEFNWDPPKLCFIKEEEVVKWVCEICGFVARSDQVENYTKHGFTYCSIACLSEHRKRNFL